MCLLNEMLKRSGKVLRILLQPVHGLIQQKQGLAFRRSALQGQLDRIERNPCVPQSRNDVHGDLDRSTVFEGRLQIMEIERDGITKEMVGSDRVAKNVHGSVVLPPQVAIDEIFQVDSRQRGLQVHDRYEQSQRPDAGVAACGLEGGPGAEARRADDDRVSLEGVLDIVECGVEVFLVLGKREVEDTPVAFPDAVGRVVAQDVEAVRGERVGWKESGRLVFSVRGGDDDERRVGLVDLPGRMVVERDDPSAPPARERDQIALDGRRDLPAADPASVEKKIREMLPELRFFGSVFTRERKPVPVGARLGVAGGPTKPAGERDPVVPRNLQDEDAVGEGDEGRALEADSPVAHVDRRARLGRRALLAQTWRRLNSDGDRQENARGQALLFYPIEDGHS